MKIKNNRISKEISPFLVLAIPFFVAFVLMGVHSSTEIIKEKIQLSAAFIELPEINIFKVLFRL